MVPRGAVIVFSLAGGRSFLFSLRLWKLFVIITFSGLLVISEWASDNQTHGDRFIVPHYLVVNAGVTAVRIVATLGDINHRRGAVQIVDLHPVFLILF